MAVSTAEYAKSVSTKNVENYLEFLLFRSMKLRSACFEAALHVLKHEVLLCMLRNLKFCFACFIIMIICSFALKFRFETPKLCFACSASSETLKLWNSVLHVLKHEAVLCLIKNSIQGSDVTS